MHCHLDLYPDPFRVSEECKARGTYILSVTTTPRAWSGTRKLAEGNQRVRTALGLHPQLAHQRADEVELFDAMLSNAEYVGEIGLDGGKGFKDHWETQLVVFRQLLRSVNRVGGRIMTIHSRGSAAAVLNELEDIEGIPILHWFTGTPDQLKRAITMGCWFSVGPAMLASQKGRGLASMMPREHVLTETDGPFTRYSNRALMPWDANLSTEILSTIWRCDKREAEETIDNNFKRICRMGNRS